MKRVLFRVIYVLILGATVLVQVVTAQSTKDTPRVWEAPLVIPTYELNPPNPYPALLAADRGARARRAVVVERARTNHKRCSIGSDGSGGRCTRTRFLIRWER